MWSQRGNCFCLAGWYEVVRNVLVHEFPVKLWFVQDWLKNCKLHHFPIELVKWFFYSNPVHGSWQSDHVVRAVAMQFAWATRIATGHAQGFECEADYFVAPIRRPESWRWLIWENFERWQRGDRNRKKVKLEAVLRRKQVNKLVVNEKRKECSSLRNGSGNLLTWNGGTDNQSSQRTTETASFDIEERSEQAEIPEARGKHSSMALTFLFHQLLWIEWHWTRFSTARKRISCQKLSHRNNKTPVLWSSVCHTQKRLATGFWDVSQILRHK